MTQPRAFIVVLVVAATAFVAATGPASAALPKYCGSITGPHWTYLTGAPSGTKYRVNALGSFACASAKSWVSKLIKDTVKVRDPHRINPNVLTNGPKGYRCVAASSKEGKAFSGDCTKGPVLRPTSGFTWAGSAF